MSAAADRDAVRARIDALDDAILALLGTRAALVADLWASKAVNGVPLKDEEREAAVFARLRAMAQANGLDPDRVEAVFRQIVGVSLRP